MSWGGHDLWVALEHAADNNMAVIDNVREDVSQVALGIEVVEFGSPDERVNRGGSLPSTIGTRE